MSVDQEFLAGLLPSWGFGSFEAEPDLGNVGRGTNNRTYFVKHDAERYVLRISQSLSPAEVRAEHMILWHLRHAELPFRVPEPIAALNGVTVVPTASGPATVCRWIPGHALVLDDEPSFEHYGRAAAQLDDALVRISLPDVVRDWRSDPLQVPGLSDLRALGDHLRAAGIAAERTTVLETAARRVAERWAGLRAELPSQVIHGDLAAGNVLADRTDGRVTAVLDFEFAGAGFRVQDFAAALYNSGALGRTDWQSATAALARGYASVCRLSAAEIDAIPVLLLARSVGSILWRARRWRVAQAQLDEVTVRLRKLETLSVWLAGDREQFRELMADAHRG